MFQVAAELGCYCWSVSGRNPCCHGCHLEAHASESPGQKWNLIRCLQLPPHQHAGADKLLEMQPAAVEFIFKQDPNFISRQSFAFGREIIFPSFSS